MTKDDCPADVLFAVSKKSKDYQRLKGTGSVVNYGGLRYKLKFLLADKIISSHADVEVTNPFLRQIDHFVDLYDFDFIFLQHGIISNNLSGWLNRFDKNISLFITSAHKEYESILTYPYNYTEDNLLLSGMPRYDELNSNPKNKIVITPTYRNNLLRLKTDKFGARQYDEKFKESEYYNFYSQLISDPRLLSVMKDHNVTGEFYIHPNFAVQSHDFLSYDVFQIQTFPYDYSRAVSEGSLLISDYSSVVFDFAYLRKPVIYTHFDIDTFFNGHSYERGSFFSVEDDGFGPVTVTLDGLIKAAIDNIEQDFSISREYTDRIDRFYAHNDRRNSERVYKAII